MKQVETSQVFDVETAGEMVSQFGRCKQVKAECHTSAVAEVDFTPVPDVILFQFADVEGDRTSFWQAVELLASRHRRSIFWWLRMWDSSCPAASLQVGIDARGTRGDLQRRHGTSIGALDG